MTKKPRVRQKLAPLDEPEQCAHCHEPAAYRVRVFETDADFKLALAGEYVQVEYMYFCRQCNGRLFSPDDGDRRGN